MRRPRPDRGRDVGPGFHHWPSGHIPQTPDRKRHRPICPNGATHTSPGHRPGNRIRKSRCVLKEHRIGRAGSMSEAGKLCGVPSEREECCRVDSQGWHPGLVCDALGFHRTPREGWEDVVRRAASPRWTRGPPTGRPMPRPEGPARRWRLMYPGLRRSVATLLRRPVLILRRRGLSNRK